MKPCVGGGGGTIGSATAELCICGGTVVGAGQGGVVGATVCATVGAGKAGVVGATVCATVGAGEGGVVGAFRHGAIRSMCAVGAVAGGCG